MSALKIIAIISLILAAAGAIATVVIFVKLKIWKVMSDRSGKTAQLSIERIRSESGRAEKQRRKHRRYMAAGSPAGAKEQGTQKIREPGTQKLPDHETQNLRTEETAEEQLLPEGQTKGTTVLEGAATTVLSSKTPSLGRFVLVKDVLITHTDEYLSSQKENT